MPAEKDDPGKWKQESRKTTHSDLQWKSNIGSDLWASAASPSYAPIRDIPPGREDAPRSISPVKDDDDKAIPVDESEHSDGDAKAVVRWCERPQEGEGATNGYIAGSLS